MRSSDSETLTSLCFPDDLSHLALLRENLLQTPLSFVLRALEGVPQAQTGTCENFSFTVRQLLAQQRPFVYTLVTSSVTLAELGCFGNVFGNVCTINNTSAHPSCLRVIEGLPSKKQHLSQLTMKHSVMWEKFDLWVQTYFKNTSHAKHTVLDLFHVCSNHAPSNYIGQESINNLQCMTLVYLWP